LKPLLRSFLEAASHNPIEGGRHAEVAWQFARLAMEHVCEHIHSSVAFEGAPSAQHLVEHGSQSEDVRARIDGLAARLLGRHVADGADGHVGRRGAGVRRDRVGRDGRRRRRQRHDAEIEEFQAAVGAQKHVLGLEVAMDDAALVRGGERVGHLDRVVERLSNADRAGRQTRPQRLALQQLHHDVGGRFVAADVVDAHDARMRKGGERLPFTFEADKGGAVVRHVRCQHLDCHIAIQA
jgi:hypothetical protein